MERVRTRAFVLTTLGLPVFLGAIFAVPTLLGAREGARERTLVILDRTDVLASRLGTVLEGTSFRVTVLDPDLEEEQVRALVEEREAGSGLILDEETVRSGRARLVVRSTPGPNTLFTLQQAVAGAALQLRLEQGDAPPGLVELARGGGLELRRVGDAAEGEEGLDRAAGTLAGFLGAFLLYMVLILYGTAVMRSVLEEKSGRMVEIILAALHPRDLMLGKIVGVGAVGLTQLSMWVLMAVAAVRLLPERLLGGPERLDAARGLVPSPGVLVLLLTFFTLGYLLYASLYAAAGAVCSREEEAQQAQLPVTLILVVPVILLPPVVDDPHATFAVGMAMVPFFAPVLQFARAAAGAASGWQVGVTLAIMVATIPLVAGVAGRIYQAGILMQGKRPGPGALWRMLRAGE